MPVPSGPGWWWRAYRVEEPGSGVPTFDYIPVWVEMGAQPDYYRFRDGYDSGERKPVEDDGLWAEPCVRGAPAPASPAPADAEAWEVFIPGRLGKGTFPYPDPHVGTPDLPATREAWRSVGDLGPPVRLHYDPGQIRLEGWLPAGPWTPFQVLTDDRLAFRRPLRREGT